MKFRKSVVILMTALFGCSLLAGCGGARGADRDPKTLNIAMAESGYGSGWVTEIGEAFEKLYALQGYKVNLLKPRSTLTGRTALSEMRLGIASGVDLWLVTGVTIPDALDEEYGVCVEKMTDMYEQKPINFDGSEGQTALKDLYKSRLLWTATDEAGDFWSYAFSESVRGLVCNAKVLQDYGITEMPRTTNELFDCYDKIYNGANGKKGSTSTGVYPTTWGGNNAYGYTLSTLWPHLAQLMGVAAYEDFADLNYLRDDLQKLASGYEVYDGIEQDVVEAVKVYLKEYDVVYSTPGSSTQKHDVAHARLVLERAAFTTDGEYFYNEIRTNFPDKVGNLKFIPIPMISYLGQKLQLDGTGTDAAKCDKILSHMIKLIDEGKSAAQIKSEISTQFSVTISDEQVARVTEARHTNFGSYNATGGYITKNSEKADIAKLFLRMMASRDGAKVLAKYGMLSAYEKAEASDFASDFSKSALEISKNSVHYVDYNGKTGSLRTKMNLFILPGYNATLPVQVAEQFGVVDSPNKRNYAEMAQAVYDKAEAEVRTNWKTYLQRAGYDL